MKLVRNAYTQLCPTGGASYLNVRRSLGHNVRGMSLLCLHVLFRFVLAMSRDYSQSDVDPLVLVMINREHNARLPSVSLPTEILLKIFK